MSDWMNIGLDNVNVQSLIEPGSNQEKLTFEKLNSLLNIYGLELVNLPYQSVLFYKSGHSTAYLEVHLSNTSLIFRDKYFISRTIKFKGTSDYQTRTFNKTSNDTYIIAEQGPWQIIYLYLNEFGMELIGGGYVGNSQSLLKNTILKPDLAPTNNPVAYTDGFLSFSTYRTLGHSVTGLGGNVPYDVHKSYDVSNKGYSYFNFINTEDNITYIGYFGSNGKTFENGGHWSSENPEVYIDTLGNSYRGPFLVLKYNNQYISKYEKAQWNRSNDKWTVTDLQLEIPNKTLDWYIYTDKNSSAIKVNSQVNEILKSKFPITWIKKNFNINCEESNEYAMSFELKIEIPNLSNKIDSIIESPYEELEIISDTTDAHDLVEKNDNNSFYYRAFKIPFNRGEWGKTGNYEVGNPTPTENERNWCIYNGVQGIAINPLFQYFETGSDIQIIKIAGPMKLESRISDSYPYNKNKTSGKDGTRAGYGDDAVLAFCLGNTTNSSKGIMRDFANIYAPVSGRKPNDAYTYYSLSVANSWTNDPTDERIPLTNSLSTGQYYPFNSTDKNDSLQYGFFTMYADGEATESMYLIFAPKNLKGEDF